ESELLIEAARPLSAFVARLFQVEPARQAFLDTAAREAAIFGMKTFIGRRAMKKYPADKLPAGADPVQLRAAVRDLCATMPDAAVEGDEELTVAHVLDALLSKEKAGETVPELDLFERWAAVHRFD